MIAVRPFAERDRAFVVSTWVNSLRNSDHAGMIAHESWHPVMRPQVNRLLDSADVRTLVAHETEDPDPVADLYGFLTAGERDPHVGVPVVFYCYVRQPVRRMGIARRLFAAAGIDPASPFHFACRTSAVGELYAARKIPCAKFTPMLARLPRPRRQEPHP